MGSRSEPLKATQLFGRLSADQQVEFGKVVIEKLRTLIGGYGELNVLAEYIAVMLQSSRPPEQIQSELEAFLQDQSQPFTDWLFEQLAKHAGEEQGPPPDAKGEALLLRAVQDARQGAVAAAAAEGARSSRHRERADREWRSSRDRESAGGRTSSAAAVPERGGEAHGPRSRSRPRRRRDKAAAGAGRQVVLTPNVQFLRDAYHQKGVPPEDAAANQPALSSSADIRWHFRAEPTAAPAPGAASVAGASTGTTGAVAAHWQAHGPPGAAEGAPAGPHPAGPGVGSPPGAPPPHHPAAAAYPHPGSYPGYHAPPPGAPHQEPQAPAPAPARPRHFVPKKWKVGRANTVVRATEHLQSEEVQMLQDGEIVEQVAPAFKLKNGIVRIQIRHPSSPHFPNPIGWVTQDATAAGGPKFLEPGPEPMQKGHWRPPSMAMTPSSSSGWEMPPMPWRPRGPPPGAATGGGSATKGGTSSRQPGPYGFQNLTWTPSTAKTSGGGGGTEPITIPG